MNFGPSNQAGMQPGGAPWSPPAQQSAPRRSWSWVSVAALVAALAALGVAGSVAVEVHKHGQAASASPAAAPNTESADRALCESVAPLLAEDDRTSNTFIDLGAAGSPARDEALPKFRTDTEDWAKRIQAVVDQHGSADPFLRRTLQRMIDDRVLLVRNMRPGPPKRYDDTAWDDHMVAYGGPLSVCFDLGVKW